MKRTLYQNLLEWKSNQRRKPLLLQGARQVGKTWLINEFGKKEYKNYKIGRASCRERVCLAV